MASVTLSGTAGKIALAVFAAFVVLIMFKPAVLSWVLAAFYNGPR